MQLIQKCQVHPSMVKDQKERLMALKTKANTRRKAKTQVPKVHEKVNTVNPKVEKTATKGQRHGKGKSYTSSHSNETGYFDALGRRNSYSNTGKRQRTTTWKIENNTTN